MTSEEFKKIYSQFSEVSDDVVNRYLNDFSIFFGDFNFGGQAVLDTAQGLYTAHYLTLETYRTIDKDNIENALIVGTVIRRESTPEYTLSYDVPKSFIEGNPNFSQFLTTIYGQKLIFIIFQKTPVAILT